MARFRRLSDLNDPLPFVDPRWQYLLPEAPTAVTATAGNAQATVSWTAPESIVDITDYYVQFQPSGGGWSTFSDGVSSGTSATVTGLTNGTAYQFRVAAVSGIGQGAWSSASSAVTPTAVTPDPYIASVELLLHMDGSGATFIDSSPSPATVTAYGNATQATDQSKFGGKSLRLAGTGDYLTFTGVPSIGTGDFCVEFWAYSGWSGPMMLWDFRSHAGLAMWTDGTSLIFFNSGSFASRATLTANQWQHIAVTRSGTTLRLFVDGVQQYSTTDGSSFNTAGGTNWIGKPYDANWSVPNLWMDDFRLSTVARYTANFTPPTAAFPDA